MSTETLYFCDEEYTERVSAIIAARIKLGHHCRIAISAAEGRPNVTCMFIAAPGRINDYEGRIALAASLGSRIDQASIDGEERRYSVGAHREDATKQVYAAYRVPTSPQEFYGFWYQKLDSHARHWQPRVTNRGILGELFLLVGGSGVGKTCSVTSVLLNSIRRSLRICDICYISVNDFEEPQSSVSKRASKSTTIDEADGSDIAACGTRLSSCYRTAVEHFRKIKSRQLASNALLIVFFDDLEDVGTHAMANAYLSTLAKLTALAVKQPRNLALIASCDDWYSKSPLIKALHSDAERLPYAVVQCTIQAPSVDMLFECLQKCYSTRSNEEKSRIAKSNGAGGDFMLALRTAATSANGNFRAAFHIAEYGAQPNDEFQNAATAMHLHMLVKRVASSKPNYSSTSKHSAKLSPLLFNEIDRACDVDYGDETIFSNYRALVTSQYSHPELGDNGLSSLDRISQVVDFLSVSDLYGTNQRDTHYAGRDGVDVDKQLLTALSTTAPILLLGVAARSGKPPAGRLDMSGTNARSSRESLRQNAELIIQLRPVISMLSLCTSRAALALAIETATYGVRRVRHANLSQSMATMEMMEALGVKPYVWLRQYGMTEKQAIDVIVFAQQMRTGHRTSDAITSECTKLERAHKDEVPQAINLKAQLLAPLVEKETTDNAAVATKPAKKHAAKRARGSAKLTDYFPGCDTKKPKPASGKLKTRI